MIIVAGTVRIDPASLHAARDIMQSMIASSLREDGCIEYSYSVDVLDPGLVRVYEVWRDKDALQAHFKTPHLEKWRAAWPTFGITDRKLQLIEVAAMSPL
ncbi:MAG: putative quinol monooxygenase [Micropepsaceae bacterium]